jgi:hypothetical protein
MSHQHKKRIYYLTYNEAYSGVYQSQIIDVTNFLNTHFDVHVSLIALVPFRNYKKLKADFKEKFPEIHVLPSFPRMKWWKYNYLILQAALQKADAIIARNPIASNIALALQKNGFCKKVCADIRGAFAAEFKEYLTTDQSLVELARKLEIEAVEKSNVRIFVTTKLLEYYQNISQYSGDAHVIIPTTLDNSFQRELPNHDERRAKRKSLHIPDNATVIAFSGGNADWQSFQMIDEFFNEQLTKDPNSFALVLSKTDISEWKSVKAFKHRMVQQFVRPDEVFNLLSVCDYGLLLREASVTNHVASPTKCAEYLAAGLPVIISQNIGDYSAQITKENLGHVYTDDYILLKPTSEVQRRNMQCFAEENYFKHSAENQLKYIRLIDLLSFQ